jgi:hypothetical protein
MDGMYKDRDKIKMGRRKGRCEGGEGPKAFAGY